MRHRTIHERTARWLLFAALIIFTVVVSFAVASRICVNAQPYDPFVPLPPLWCPGGGTSVGYYGGYCEGVSYADGTRWNAYRSGYFWQPMRCIVANSGIVPVLAPHGCGAVVR